MTIDTKGNKLIHNKPMDSQILKQLTYGEFYEEIRTKRKNTKTKSFCLSPLNHGSTSLSANNLHTVN
jgi:hypothetical protein